MKTPHLMLAAAVLAAWSISACTGSSTHAAASAAADPQTLTIYTARDKDMVALVVDRFVQHYPQYRGKINVVYLSAQEALTRLRAERGNPQAGFLWGNTQQGLEQAAREGLLASSNPDAAAHLDASRRDPEGRWYAEMLLPEVIVYNHDRLAVDQAPRDWDDLVSPRFKGRILIRDVMASGTMRTIFSAMIYRQYCQSGSSDAGYAWLRQLDANTINYAANPDDMYFKLDRGVGVITVWNLQDVLIQANRRHRPWTYVMPASGAPVLVDGVAVINNPRSMRVASEFENFLLSPDIQAALARDYFQIPAVPLAPQQQPAWLAALQIKAMPIDIAVFNQKQPEWMAYWAQHIQGSGR
jgi:iron(III) transport system substrate-binding protein